MRQILYLTVIFGLTFFQNSWAYCDCPEFNPQTSISAWYDKIIKAEKGTNINKFAYHFAYNHLPILIDESLVDEAFKIIKMDRPIKSQFGFILLSGLYSKCPKFKGKIISEINNAANNPHSNFYNTSLEMFFYDSNLELSGLKLNENDDFDQVIKLVIFARNEKKIENYKKLVGFLKKFESVKIIEDQRENFASECAQELIEVGSLGRIGLTVYHYKYFDLAKTIFKRTLENPFGLDPDSVREAKYGIEKFKKR